MTNLSVVFSRIIAGDTQRSHSPGDSVNHVHIRLEQESGFCLPDVCFFFVCPKAEYVFVDAMLSLFHFTDSHK